MSSPFLRLPTILPNSSYKTVPRADVDNFGRAVRGAYEHWIFDTGDVTCLTGLVQGKVLTPQSVAPTYSANYLTIITDDGKALLSDLMDSGEQSMLMVTRRLVNIVNLNILAGTWNPTADGSTVWLDNNDVNLNASMRGSIFVGPELVNPVAATEWEFIGYSESVENTRQIIFVGQSPTPVTAVSPVADKDIAPRAIALGNGYYVVSTAWVNRDYAEFILFDRGVSIEDMMNEYIGSKERMAAIGITVE